MADLTMDALLDELKKEGAAEKETIEIAESLSTIIDDIVNARISLNLTQRDLAKLCGIKQSALARMERLQAVPRLDTVIKVARKVGIKICTSKEEVVLDSINIVVNPQIIYTVSNEFDSKYDWHGVGLAACAI